MKGKWNIGIMKMCNENCKRKSERVNSSSDKSIAHWNIAKGKANVTEKNQEQNYYRRIGKWNLLGRLHLHQTNAGGLYQKTTYYQLTIGDKGDYFVVCDGRYK